MTTITKLIVQSGQYEKAGLVVPCCITTERGLMRRARQLSKEHAVYGDNWAGWIPASVAVASEDDEWANNSIIGGRHCDPTNGWLDLSE